VAGTIPKDGFGSTALVSQAKMLDDAGKDVFDYHFVDYYGTNTDQLPVWNAFLSGDIDAKKLTEKMQKISDDVAGDKDVKKLHVS
jgi:N-acetylglucosamine transport system substrate-binding protein